MAYFEGEIPVVTTGNGGYGNGFGNDAWWIIVLLIFGYGGFGRGFGGYGGGGGAATDYVLTSDFAQLDRKLDSIASGICDSTFALNNTIVNGFNNTNTALITQGYETRNAISGLATQLASCCCDIGRSIDGVNYNLAKSTCDITNAINDSTNHIIGFLTNEKISSLQLENQSLKFAASQANQNAFIAANQEAQTAELIRRLGRDVPVPSYIVPNPNCCYTTPLTVANNGCGCGCGCV